MLPQNQGIAYQNATLGAVTASQPEARETAFNNLNNELANIIDSLTHIESRLISFKERAVGVSPQTNKADPPKAVPNGHIGITADRLDVIKMVLGNLHSVMHEIEGIG